MLSNVARLNTKDKVSRTSVIYSFPPNHFAMTIQVVFNPLQQPTSFISISRLFNQRIHDFGFAFFQLIIHQMNCHPHHFLSVGYQSCSISGIMSLLFNSSYRPSRPCCVHFVFRTAFSVPSFLGTMTVSEWVQPVFWYLAYNNQVCPCL